jgi:hypothetical protein
MRTRASMGKMVNKLTNREKSESFMLIERISRGVNHPYTKEFMPTIVASRDFSLEKLAVRENAFKVAEQNRDNVVVIRSEKPGYKSQPQIVFYEYFEVFEIKPQKTG